MHERQNEPCADHVVASDLLVFPTLLVGIVALYAPLHHRYWTLGGDGDVFLSVARSLVLSEGYRFNGQPVAIIPPGWVWLLAGALHLTTRFSILKLIPAGCMIGFFALSYWVLRRWSSPLVAACCVLTAAMLEYAFGLVFLFYSDPLFMLVAMLALWLAMRVNEGADSGWRIGLVILLSVLSVSVRWTGLLWTMLICAALISGELRPALNRRWIAAGLCVVAAAGTFVLLRWALRVDPSQLDPRYDMFVAQGYDLLNIEESAHSQMTRMAQTGRLIGGLLWRVVEAIRATREIANIAGWVAIAFLLVTLVESIRRRQWLGLAAATYIAVLAINWPSPMPRYILPLAPLILLGLYIGVMRAGELLPERIRDLRWVAVHYLFASILLANVVLYAIEVRVARSRDVPRRYQAGYYKELVDAAMWLNRQPRGDYETAISSKLENFGTSYFSDGSRRALNLLTNRAIVTVPLKLCREPDEELVSWLTAHNVRYYFYQPPIELIRHFHRTGWHGLPRDVDATAWRLYEIRDGQVHRIIPDPVRRWPTRVPGM